MPNIGLEAVAIDGAVDDERGADTVVAQGGQEGHRLPMALGHLGDEPAPTPTSATGARHIGLGPGFVDEDELGAIKLGLLGAPAPAGGGDVGAILLGGVQRFF